MWVADLPADEDLTGRQRSSLDDDWSWHKHLGPMIGRRADSDALGARTVAVVVVRVDRNHAEPIRHTLQYNTCIDNVLPVHNLQYH